jgi:DNA-binding transcriptional LysR family regulator
MGNLDLAALEIFKAVAEQGGITRAAAALHRVPSNITTRVKQLEGRLGTTLFLRRNGRLALSAEGRVLLGYADRLLHLSSEAEAALRSGAPRGTLAIGALESVAAIRLPPVLSRYHRACPDVRVQLVTGTTGALVAAVLGHEVEAAFVAEPFTADGLEAQPVWSEELVLITPRSFPRLRTARELGHTTLIAFANGCSYRRRLEAWLGAARVVPERVMEFASYHAILACVAAGTGIAIVPRSVIGASRAGRDVAAHALPPAIARARTALIWRHGHRSAALRALQAQLAGRAARATRGPAAARAAAGRHPAGAPATAGAAPS